MSTNDITEYRFRCVEVRQPIGTFYVGVMPSDIVLKISHADIRRIEQRDIERVVGIQRELSPRRVRELQQYVRNIDATFPTSIILAIDGKNVAFNEKRGDMRIAIGSRVAQIIDGQHRIAGLEGFSDDFDLCVTIFVDMDLQDKAMTFATINLAQTKVNKSLVYDLYAFQKSRSPQKTCHTVARLLNREKDSPLHHRIKILGKATGGEYQNITQATFVSGLIVYISDNPDEDRDLLKRGKAIPPAPSGRQAKLMFRELFRKGKDADIANVAWDYFAGVAERWPDAWDSQESGDILNRTTGFTGLMRFLGPLYRHLGHDGFSAGTVLSILKRAKIRDNEFTRENYLPGSTGAANLYNDLRSKTKIDA